MTRPTVLLDQNLPRRAVSVFKELGIDAVHVHTVKLSGKPDRDIWRYAALNNLIIVTKDVDFTQIHDLTLKSPVRVVWLRIGNTSNKTLLPWLRLNWSRAQLRLNEGHDLIELGLL